jgi:hypothetical protein
LADYTSHLAKSTPLTLADHSSDFAYHTADFAYHTSDFVDNSSDLANLTSDLADRTSDLADHNSDLADSTPLTWQTTLGRHHTLTWLTTPLKWPTPQS